MRKYVRLSLINCDKSFNVCFNRKVFHPDNIKAYFQIKKIIEQENYDIIHCHTPIGGALTRFAARKSRKNGTKVIYTAHGFAFWKGAPQKDWMIYYNAEKFLSKYTDTLILINNEDYNIAKEKKFHAKHIFKINGVGVDTAKFTVSSSENRKIKRKALGLPENTFLILYAAEFIPRKNHIFLLHNLKSLLAEGLDIHCALLGTGKLFDEIKEKSNELKINNNVHFFGYRRDAQEFYAAADLIVAPGNQEGLPVHILEGMASGLPIVATKIRGHIDLITNERNGLLFNLNNSEEFCSAIKRIMNDSYLRNNIMQSNIEDVKKFNIENAIISMAEIYKTMM